MGGYYLDTYMSWIFVRFGIRCTEWDISVGNIGRVLCSMVWHDSRLVDTA